MTQPPLPERGAAQVWLAAAIIWLTIAAALAFGQPDTAQNIRLAEARSCP